MAEPLEEDRAPKTILEPIKFITWLGVSIGGLTIALAAVGFLNLAGHDLMLGIPERLLAQPKYITVGALFFSRTIIYMVAALANPLAQFSGIAPSLIAVVVPFLLAVVFYYLWRYLEIERYVGAINKVVRVAGPIALVILELYALRRLTEPLQITNVLLQFTDFSSVASAGYGDSTHSILKALNDDDGRFLQLAYGRLSLLVFFLALSYRQLELMSVNKKKSRASGGQKDHLMFWRWLRVPSFALLLLCIFFLTRVYGVLTIQNEYPRFERVAQTDASNPVKAAPLFLLQEDEKYLLLYDPCSQSMLSIKRDSVEQMKTSAPKNLFQYQLKEADRECQKISP